MYTARRLHSATEDGWLWYVLDEEGERVDGGYINEADAHKCAVDLNEGKLEAEWDESLGQWHVSAPAEAPPARAGARYRHECEYCKYIGQIGRYDLHLCSDINKVVLRWGDEDGDEDDSGEPFEIHECGLSVNFELV